MTSIEFYHDVDLLALYKLKADKTISDTKIGFEHLDKICIWSCYAEKEFDANSDTEAVGIFLSNTNTYNN